MKLARLLEEYAYSDTETPPDLSNFITGSGIEHGGEIQTVTSQELVQLADSTDPLDYGEPASVEQILKNTSILESISVDEEAMQFYLAYAIDQLWKCAFGQEKSTVDKIKLEAKNGNEYHDTVVKIFLSEYKGTKSIKLPQGYAFPYLPTLMQSYVAYKVKNSPSYGNFSGSGAGKTLSAVLASRIIDSKLTLVVCPNDVVEQWTKSIKEIFPKSFTKAGKDTFYVTYDKSKYQYQPRRLTKSYLESGKTESRFCCFR